MPELAPAGHKLRREQPNIPVLASRLPHQAVHLLGHMHTFGHPATLQTPPWTCAPGTSSFWGALQHGAGDPSSRGKKHSVWPKNQFFVANWCRETAVAIARTEPHKLTRPRPFPKVTMRLVLSNIRLLVNNSIKAPPLECRFRCTRYSFLPSRSVGRDAGA